MSRRRIWRLIVRDALIGHAGKPVSNQEVYAFVAKEIGAKELTYNQKAKVRQQLQKVGIQPKKAGKPQAGKRRLKVKRPTKRARQKLVKDGSKVLGRGKYVKPETNQRFHRNHETVTYEYAFSGDIHQADLLTIAEMLEKQYGEVDTSIDIQCMVFEETVTTRELDMGAVPIGEQWINISYAFRPTTAATQAPMKLQDWDVMEQSKYRSLIQHIVKVAFTLFIPI